VKVNILGVKIDRMDMLQTIQKIKKAIEERNKLFVVVPNVFVVTECRRDKEYMKIINSADIAFADGVPLVWASYLFGKYTGGRVSGADFFSIFNKISEEKGYSCFYLGGGPGGSEKVAENFKMRYPKLKIVGNYSPPLGEISDRLNNEIIERINGVKPDILWVGLGAPRQEIWIYKNINRLKVNIVVGVGAAFDYQAGTKRRAPKWMQKIAMEWSYRILFENPSLFWKKRYYSYIWEFILPVIAQIIKERIAIISKERKHA
jgi:N-acetylglucosaminyldiphosphoundecaprenol N-acetyl-beta-D-mannosaminyltransferase